MPEALRMLANHKGRARVISGGTDVVVALRRREYEVDALVDISRIPGLARIEQQADNILLGGLVTHAQVERSALIKDKAGLLASACAAMGSPQIRSIATVAGNLVSGQPAADASIPLLALGARVTITSAGRRASGTSGGFLFGRWKDCCGPNPRDPNAHRVQSARI